MSNKFLYSPPTYKTDITNGSLPVYANTLRAVNLSPDSFVKTDASGFLISENAPTFDSINVTGTITAGEDITSTDGNIQGVGLAAINTTTQSICNVSSNTSNATLILGADNLGTAVGTQKDPLIILRSDITNKVLMGYSVDNSLFGINVGANLGPSPVIGSTPLLAIENTGNITINGGDVLMAGNDISGATSISATNLTGTLQTALQGNITSVGTLTGLTMGGDVLMGTNNISGATSITATNLTGTLQTALQGNITSVGTLNTLDVSETIKINNSVTENGLTMRVTSDTLTNGVYFQTASNWYNWAIERVKNPGGSSDGDLVFSGGFDETKGNLTEYLKMDYVNSRITMSNANVGIGVNPSYKLDVFGDINTTGVYRKNGVEVLNATTLGSGIVNSSLTSVGTLNTLDVSTAIGSSPTINVTQLTDNTDLVAMRMFGTQGTDRTWEFRIGTGGGESLFRLRDVTANADRIVIDETGMVGIGIINPQKILQVDSTTSGILFPRMTTTQRDAITTPLAGEVLYNTTTNKLQVYNGTTWNDTF